MTEIQRYETPTGERHDSWAQMLPAVGDLAGKIAQTSFVPAALQGKPAAVAAAILAGREAGLGPMASLQHLHVVEGRPTMSAQMQRALVLAAGHEIRFTEMTQSRCIAQGRRRGQEEFTTVTWTMDDAKKAGLDGKQNWRRHPRRMLQARASSELCQLLFADVVAGFGTTEELEDDAEGPAPVQDGNPAKKPMQRRSTPKRQASTTPKNNKPKMTAAEYANPPDGDDGPPLPGEDGYAEASTVDTKAAEVEQDELDRSDGTPGSITQAQSKKLHATFRDAGIDDRDQRLRLVAQVLHRDVDSSSNLTREEAATLIDTLEELHRDGSLIELVAADTQQPQQSSIDDEDET